jgi:hypothetical protein
MSTTTRRAVLAAAPAAAAGTLAAGTAVNAVAIAMTRATEVDPIFAVLTEHRAAMKAYLPASELSGRLEDDTPEWNAAWAVTQATIGREHASLHAVLTTDPTTLAGAMALLEHVGGDNFLGEAPEEYGTSLLAAQAPGEGLLAKAADQFPGRLAAVLRNIIERGQA